MKDIRSDLIEKLSELSPEEILLSEKDGAYYEALSPDRENLAEWFPFGKDQDLLICGDRFGAFLPLLKKTASLSFYDPEGEDVFVIRKRLERQLPEAQDRVSFLTELSCRTFDSILFLFGEGKNSLREQTEFLRDHLKPGGSFLISAENRDALKFQTGTGRQPEMQYVSLEELRAASPAEDFAFSRMYYPLPCASFARELKSDAMLPSPGDFRGISESFTEERYALCDEEALYDRLFREDPEKNVSYLPSFFLVQSGFSGEKSSAQTDGFPAYIRYNRQRKPEYRIKTEVYPGDRVEKSALGKAAEEHIESFPEKYRLLTGENTAVSVLPVTIRKNEGKTAAVFPFVTGISLEKKLSSAISGGKAPEEEIKAYLDLLAPAAAAGKNLDSLFENVMLTGEGTPLLLDYEWVREEEFDPGFLRYRILRYFYENHRETLSAYGGLTQFLSVFQVGQEQAYEQAEDEFQFSVHGNDANALRQRYRKESVSLSGIREMARQLSASEDRIHRLTDETKELKETLSKEREVERLSQQHIRNIEKINRLREEELQRMQGELSYLSAHESLPSRVKRGLIRRIDSAAPQGSAKRLVLRYMKGLFRSPGTTLHRLFTKEGHEFLRGEFAIRGEFSEGGILTLPETAEGQEILVSIIIPAYNQVSYTYACIRSILEHTDETATPYEVILADDASTDATAEITRWIRNLKVAKTSGNLGFLKNCNHAAETASGRYLLFLNNDTKVTDGWLSSLCDLMQRDPSIGMTGSKLIYPDGRLQEAGGIIWSDGSGWNYGRMDDPSKPEYCYVKEVDYISGASILIRRELWDEIGGFDERFAPAYCEDSDLAFMVRKHGKKVVFQPASVVIHFEGVSNGTDVTGTGLKRYQTVNQEKFREKWKEELKKQSVNTGSPNPFAARERSQQKKHILVIDHYVPEWDRDAGSKTTWQYMKMFLEKGYQVKFLGDNFLRKDPYSYQLEQMGIEVLTGEDMRENYREWIRKNSEFLDFVYLNRPHIAIRYIEFLKENTKAKCIFYGHDLHFLRIQREYELSGDIRKLRESEYWRSIEFQVMEKADMTYYPSEEEIREIHRRRPEIRAKAITAYIYDDPFEEKEGEEEKTREGFLFVGGFRHPPNEDGVKWFLKECWPRIRTELPEAHFYIAGSHPTEDLLAYSGKENVEVLGFVSDERLKELYHQTRITVVPLRYGAGVKGKVIEALNEGSAIVTTSVGAEGIPEAEKVMKISDSPAGFAGAVSGLYGNETELTAMRRAAPEYIRRYFSTEAVWSTVREDFT